MNEPQLPLRRIRSFVRRDSRMTAAQQAAFEKLWPIVGLQDKSPLDMDAIFKRSAPRVLEIGFGSGQSLLVMAKNHPEQDFIGIETHRPGIGSLLLGMELQEVSNIKVFYADAVEVLEKSIPDESFECIQIFFPDPWPKRKHHKRRLIQVPFINLLKNKLKKSGTIHIATDWEHYAHEMMETLSSVNGLCNLAGEQQFSNRSTQRPIITKFEQRGKSAGRQIWELQFAKNFNTLVPLQN